MRTETKDEDLEARIAAQRRLAAALEGRGMPELQDTYPLAFAVALPDRGPAAAEGAAA